MARPHTRVHSEAGRSQADARTCERANNALHEPSSTVDRWCGSDAALPKKNTTGMPPASAGCASNEAGRVPEKSGIGSGDPGGRWGRLILIAEDESFIALDITLAFKEEGRG
jgi:hypothetical protein